jgi:hypothetical protein
MKIYHVKFNLDYCCYRDLYFSSLCEAEEFLTILIKFFQDTGLYDLKEKNQDDSNVFYLNVKDKLACLQYKENYYLFLNKVLNIDFNYNLNYDNLSLRIVECEINNIDSFKKMFEAENKRLLVKDIIQ